MLSRSANENKLSKKLFSLLSSYNYDYHVTSYEYTIENSVRCKILITFMYYHIPIWNSYYKLTKLLGISMERHKNRTELYDFSSATDRQTDWMLNTDSFTF